VEGVATRGLVRHATFGYGPGMNFNEWQPLVAPNAFHHMGQAAWRARFPKATSYAPEGALPRLGKKARDVPFRPLAELTAKLPERVKLFVPAGMKAPDLMAHATTPEGAVWFGGDLISNTLSDDLSFGARLIFGLLGGGPGYRFNSVPAMVYLRDRAAWKAAVRAAVEQAPIAVMLPAHGEPVRDDATALTRAILA
jgi:hypothetical protein